MTRKPTPEQLAAARKLADKYIARPGHIEPAQPSEIPAEIRSDDIATTARFIIGTPMGCRFGNVDRHDAMDALARLAGRHTNELRREFDPTFKVGRPPRPSVAPTRRRKTT